MIRYFFWLIFLISTSCQNTTKTTFKLVTSNESNEQYLTIIDSNIYYHGIVNEITPVDSNTLSKVYFVSKAVNKESDISSYKELEFYNFIHSKKPIGIVDWNKTQLDNQSIIFSMDTYNSIWGRFKEDTLVLNATKHLYDSRVDLIKFIKID